MAMRGRLSQILAAIALAAHIIGCHSEEVKFSGHADLARKAARFLEETGTSKDSLGDVAVTDAAAVDPLEHKKTAAEAKEEAEETEETEELEAPGGAKEGNEATGTEAEAGAKGPRTAVGTASKVKSSGAEGVHAAEAEPNKQGAEGAEGEHKAKGAEGEEGEHKAEGAEGVEGEHKAEGEEGELSAEGGAEHEEHEGKHGEGEGHEEGEEEEEEGEFFSPVDIGMAWMLLGSVAFVMILFYLVNFKDDDIRRYSWGIISTTISIFSAVLLFSGINEFVMTFIPGEARRIILVVTIFLFFAWFLMLQASIAIISGANCESEAVDLKQEVWTIADTMRADYGDEVADTQIRTKTGHRSVANLEGVEVFVVKKKALREVRVRRMKCWATLLAHMTGFAAINMGGALQHLKLFRQTWWMTMLSVGINQLLLQVLFSGTAKLRHLTSGLDGKRDERDKLCDEEVQEAENDIASLAVSFLTVQSIRFALSGVLPNAEGLEEPEQPHSMQCIVSLYLIALAALVCFLVVMLVTLKCHFVHTYHLHRQFEILQNQFAMVFAWCVLWATRWYAVKSSVLVAIGGPGAMAGRICLALVLSSASFLAIFALDKVEDLGKSDHAKKKDMVHMQKVIQCIINSLGILVGFSWEHCFDGGVSAVASLTKKPVTVKLLLGIVVPMIIIPAWRRFILSKVIYLETLHREVMLAAAPHSHAAGHGHGAEGHGAEGQGHDGALKEYKAVDEDEEDEDEE